MVDIVNAIAAMQQPGPINMLSGIEGLKSQRNQNQLVQRNMERQQGLQSALAGGDINALAAIDPIQAANLQAVQQEQFRRSASVLGPLASRIANSKSPRAMAKILQSAPELQDLPQSMRDQIAGIDFDAMTDDELRAEAQALVDQFAAGQSGLTGQTANTRTHNALLRAAQGPPGDARDAARIALGLDPRAGTVSKDERIAGDDDLTTAVAGSRAEIAGEVESAKSQAQLDVERGKVDQDRAQTFALWETTRDSLMSALAGTRTGPVSGLSPAVTAPQQIADSAVAAAAPVLKQLFRAAGEGIFTDKDQELLLAMVPTRTTLPEARAAQMQLVDSIIRVKLAPSGTFQSTEGISAYDKARNAIKRGADPVAVAERLREAGFDPSLL